MVATIDDAVELMTALLALPEMQSSTVDGEPSLASAIADHDMPTLYRGIMEGFSYQGIADGLARDYIARHGNAEWQSMIMELAAQPACPKLAGFSAFRGCGYRKLEQACARPDLLGDCPVPRLPLRKGGLNEQAFSAFLFLRDHAGGDLVSFIDETLAIAALSADPITIGREALVASLTGIVGVSRKLASMTLAGLLLAGATRPGWVEVGRSMVAVDTLVHNFLHRTGILAACGAPHAYGPRCIGRDGCEAIIRDLTERLQARVGGVERQRIFPRAVQHAIWRFCASDELSICNGNNIRATATCELHDCPLRDRCSRSPLRPSTVKLP